MSLFQAREWWSTWCGGAEEEFDIGNLCVANIDNNADGLDKLITGSLNGVLRIFIPQKDGFKADDLMLEVQLNQPLLQLVSGKFVSGTDLIHLCVLHPRSLSVYKVSAVHGTVEHGNIFTLTKSYEHRLERSAACMTSGQFGGVTGRDFICVLSMDGTLAFYEQETFSLKAFLPNFLLPGPFIYVSATDSFIVTTSGRNVESYRYHTLASSANNDKSAKKISPDWSKSIGEHILDIQLDQSLHIIYLLGEHSLFKLSTSGDILIMKKLEYNPSCFLPYLSSENQNSNMVIVGSHSSSLQIYNEIVLVWASQLPHVPVACKIGKFEGIEGVIVTLDEFGQLYTSYLGTDPSLFVAPQVESRMGNFEQLENELKHLNSIIKKADSGKGQLATLDNRDYLDVNVLVPDSLDEISQCMEQVENDDEYGSIPSITIKVILVCKTVRPIENITLQCSADYPLICSHPQIDVPIIGNKGPELSFEISFYTTGGVIPSELIGIVTATYTNESDGPRVVQAEFELPLMLIANGSPPLKQANYKLTIDTNKEPVNLAEIFPEMVNEAVIPVPVLGIQYIGGPVVTILSSKQSNRYRIQCDLFEAMYLVLKELLKRLQLHFNKRTGETKLKCTYQGPLPLNDYFELVDNHFQQRLCLKNYKELMNQRAQQFRVIQKRLLTRFKDKTPSPLAHLDTLLDGTYKQILALSDELENTKAALKHSGVALSCGTRLITFLLRLFVSMSEDEFKILEACLTPVVTDALMTGWQETVNNNISHLLRTCLAKSAKEQNANLQSNSMDKDTNKLKRHLALMCERLNKGGSLKFNEKKKLPKTKDTIDEEDDLAAGFQSLELGKRIIWEGPEASKQH